MRNGRTLGELLEARQAAQEPRYLARWQVWAFRVVYVALRPSQDVRQAWADSGQVLCQVETGRRRRLS